MVDVDDGFEDDPAEVSPELPPKLSMVVLGIAEGAAVTVDLARFGITKGNARSIVSYTGHAYGRFYRTRSLGQRIRIERLSRAQWEADVRDRERIRERREEFRQMKYDRTHSGF